MSNIEKKSFSEIKIFLNLLQKSFALIFSKLIIFFKKNSSIFGIYQLFPKKITITNSNILSLLPFTEAFTATWSKFYCTYKKQQKLFSMLPYNQISGRTEQPPETLTLTTCTRRASDFEKRFCFDLTFEQKPGITFTFQALSEEDRKVWLNAMDGKEPVRVILFYSI